MNVLLLLAYILCLSFMKAASFDRRGQTSSKLSEHLPYGLRNRVHFSSEDNRLEHINAFTSSRKSSSITSTWAISSTAPSLLNHYLMDHQHNHNHKRHRHHNQLHRHHVEDFSVSGTRNKASSHKRTVTSPSDEGNLNRDYMASVIGKEVQLDCKMKSTVGDDDKIVWLRMPKGEVLTFNGNRVTQDARINSKCIPNQMPCWSLTIIDTRESDSGFYVCQTNLMQTKYIYLDIMGK
jgi:hypothetical protein